MKSETEETRKSSEVTSPVITPQAVGSMQPSDKSGTIPKAKESRIAVSKAVLDAASEEVEGLLRSLRTRLDGLTQIEAEERFRSVGPNEVAEEQRRNWAIRLLKIIR